MRTTPSNERTVRTLRRARSLAVLLVLTVASCATDPLTREEMREPALLEIHDAFAATVTRARTDPDVNWRSGWLGNIGVHLGGDADRGLCYEWQGLVYGGVRAAVAGVGWEATGITINRHTSSEHHAVVVYDPRRLREEDLLAAPPDQPAYVLDAWRRGEPDVYPLAVWIDIPLLVRVPPRLEEPYPGRAIAPSE